MLVKTDGVLINFPAIVDPQEDGALEVSDAASDVLVDIVRSMPIGCALNAITYVMQKETDRYGGWTVGDVQTIYDAIASNLHNRFIETYEDKAITVESIKGRDVYITLADDKYPDAAYADRDDVRGSYIKRTIR